MTVDGPVELLAPAAAALAQIDIWADPDQRTENGLVWTSSYEAVRPERIIIGAHVVAAWGDRVWRAEVADMDLDFGSVSHSVLLSPRPAGAGQSGAEATPPAQLVEALTSLRRLARAAVYAAAAAGPSPLLASPEWLALLRACGAPLSRGTPPAPRT